MRRLFAALLLTAALAAAADVSGTWSGKTRVSLDGRVEEDTMYLVLKQNGDRISGTAGPTADQQAPIRIGKIEGNRITFELPIPKGVFTFDIALEGEHLTGSVVAIAQGQTIKGTLDATRAK
jgi:hypothetical protein